MPFDYIPRPDGDFDAFAVQFCAVLNDWWNAQGFDADDLLALNKAMDQWLLKYPAHVAAQAGAQAAAQAKQLARSNLVGEIRPKAQFVQAWDKTTNADRASLGITVRGRGARSLAAPATRPVFQVDTGHRLEHTLRIADETTPTRAAKPRGAIGAEVWVRLVGAGQAPAADPLQMRYLATTSRTPFSAGFTMSDGGKTAVYMLRWVSRTGETGPWSEVMSATVAA